MSKKKIKAKASIGRLGILTTAKGGPHADKTKRLRCRDKFIEDNNSTTQESIGESQ